MGLLTELRAVLPNAGPIVNELSEKWREIDEAEAEIEEAAAAPAKPTNPFRNFWDLGYRLLVPIVPPGAPLSERSTMYKRLQAGKDARGKVPGYRGDDGLWRGFKWESCVATEDLLERWHAMGASVGIRTGDQGDGTSLIAIDADTLDKDLANRIEKVIRSVVGITPVRVGRAPKALYLIRISGTVPYTRIDFGPGKPPERVELLSDGRQFVAHGVHPVTREPYDWARDLVPGTIVHPAEVCEKILSNLAAILPQARPIVTEGAGAAVDQESLRGDLASVTAAVEALPNEGPAFETREAWLRVGYAIKGALPDHPTEAFDLFAAWSEKWVGPDGDVNEPDYIESEWRRCKPPFRLGASYLYEVAEKHGGWTGRQSALAAKHFENPGPKAELADSAASRSQAPPARLQFHLIAEAAQRAFDGGREPLIDGLLDRETMSVVYGDSNAGKTFVVLDMVDHFARGLPWAGMAVPEGGATVAYVAAEGSHGIPARLAALVRTRGECDRFHVLISPVDLFHPDADLVPLIASLTELGRVDMVVLDTLFRVLAGGDENSGRDMGVLVRNFDRIRAAVRTHLMVIHHTGKDLARGARGHSSLRAATDTEIEVVATGKGAGVIRDTKQRDMPGGWSSVFRLRGLTLGLDARERIVSSATVEMLGPDDDLVVHQPDEDEAGRLGAAVLKVLGSRSEIRLAECWKPLGKELKALGLLEAQSKPMVFDYAQTKLGGAGIQVRSGNCDIRLHAYKRGSGKTEPWIIRGTVIDGPAEPDGSA